MFREKRRDSEAESWEDEGGAVENIYCIVSLHKLNRVIDYRQKSSL